MKTKTWLISIIILCGYADLSFPIQYTITDLGTLGGTFGVATEINEQGQVTGYATTAAGLIRAFIWSNGIISRTPASDPWALDAVYSNGINESGQLAITGDYANGGNHACYYYSNNLVSIQTVSSSYVSVSNAINNLTQPSVVGYYGTDGNSGSERAYKWNVTTGMVTLDTRSSRANDINDSDQVVGKALVTTSMGGYYHATVWAANGQATDIDSGNIFASEAVGNNAAGQVVGWKHTGFGSQFHAFSWTASGGLVDLSTLENGDYNSDARAVNDSGQVVGASDVWVGDEKTYRAFIYDNGVMTNLESLVTNLGTWKLLAAEDINNSGQIVGWGENNGQTRAFLLTTTPNICIGGTITVDDDGPADFATIQAAINAAMNCDTILVSPGHYYENIDFRGKAITLTSTNPSDPAIVAATIIDANNSGIVVSFHSGETSASILTGFTITRGHAQYGAGICCWGNCSPTISYCTITNNHNNDIDGGSGAGLYVASNSSPTLTNCTFDSNTAYSGGGIYIAHDGTFALTDCTVINNNAYQGGGIYCSSGTNTLTSCTINSNTAYSGGGIYFYGGIHTFIDCTVSANTANDSGGGFYSLYGTLTFIDCTVSANTSKNSGGGFYAQNVTLTYTDCTFTSNNAYQGGGIYSYGGTLTLTNCTVIANTATNSGGGIYYYYYSKLKLTDSIVSANAAEDGGGIYIQQYQDILIQHCTIEANEATSGYGAGIACYESNGPAEISHNIITGSEGGSGIYTMYADAVIDYNDLWNNLGGDYGGWAWPGDNDMSVDPCFVQAGYWDNNGTPGDSSDDFWVQGDYHLQPESPCINAGDPAFVPESGETDFDGNLRVRLGRVDIGANEAGSHPADFNEDGIVDLLDFNLLATVWLGNSSYPVWCPRCDIHTPKDETINLLDLSAFSDAWLWQAPWY
jgi:probable HAF family extracellular repeat protein/predicted outer membrane repeat protein